MTLASLFRRAVIWTAPLALVIAWSGWLSRAPGAGGEPLGSVRLVFWELLAPGDASAQLAYRRELRHWLNWFEDQNPGVRVEVRLFQPFERDAALALLRAPLGRVPAGQRPDVLAGDLDPSLLRQLAGAGFAPSEAGSAFLLPALAAISDAGQLLGWPRWIRPDLWLLASSAAESVGPIADWTWPDVVALASAARARTSVPVALSDPAAFFWRLLALRDGDVARAADDLLALGPTGASWNGPGENLSRLQALAQNRVVVAPGVGTWALGRPALGDRVRVAAWPALPDLNLRTPVSLNVVIANPAEASPGEARGGRLAETLARAIAERTSASGSRAFRAVPAFLPARGAWARSAGWLTAEARSVLEAAVAAELVPLPEIPAPGPWSMLVARFWRGDIDRDSFLARWPSVAPAR